VTDYAAYARVNKVDGSWKTQQRDGIPISVEGDYPVVAVNFDDANAFCEWLTRRENSGGKLPRGMKYRLPTDEEWSRAVGLAQEEGATPAERNVKNMVDYPWGNDYPPSTRKVGNYADETFHEKFPKEKGNPERDAAWIPGYTDGYATTAAVGSFTPNDLGIYDLGGNVWEWCGSWYDNDQQKRVMRGASWTNVADGILVSSQRTPSTPEHRGDIVGFRCVVALVGP
jgi:formylglycine-generating enzyme required for sulfatase activity